MSVLFSLTCNFMCKSVPQTQKMGAKNNPSALRTGELRLQPRTRLQRDLKTTGVFTPHPEGSRSSEGSGYVPFSNTALPLHWGRGEGGRTADKGEASVDTGCSGCPRARTLPL